MQTHKLKTVPAAKAKGQSILAWTGEGEVAMKGEAESGHQWLCGACDQVLIDGVQPGKIRAIIIRCKCGAYNDATI